MGGGGGSGGGGRERISTSAAKTQLTARQNSTLTASTPSKAKWPSSASTRQWLLVKP